MSQARKPKVLIFCDFYLPGYKSGGGMRTVVNMVERLGDDYEFYVVCRDHDGRADHTPYTTVKIDEWNILGKAKVFYASKNNIRLKLVKRIIYEVKPESIYSNSFFSTFAIFLFLHRRLRGLKKIPLIIAPEGEFSEGSMQLKTLKKKVYLKYAHLVKLHEKVIWKASSEAEIEEIKRFKGKDGEIFLAPNMPPKMILPEYEQAGKASKKPGIVRLIFLSRIHPTKNLKFLLNVLSEVKGEVLLDIFGPPEMPDYVEECKKIIAKLPLNIKAELRGEVHHDLVAQTLFRYDFFCLPTLGESFGHIIIESLAAGCPVLISDRTPWQDLEKKKIGWNLPLEEPATWVEALNRCVSLDQANYTALSSNARAYAVEWLADREIENATRRVLEHSLTAHEV